MTKGKIGVTTENIFPVIKKFLPDADLRAFGFTPDPPMNMGFGGGFGGMPGMGFGGGFGGF